MIKHFLSFTTQLLVLSSISVQLHLQSMPAISKNQEIQKSPVFIHLDYADDHEKKCWGLMQRRSLPNDYGMLFAYSTPTNIDLWSFNCCMDMAVAFLDDRGVIQEIKLLKAYPEMMDPHRPVYSLSDMHQYKYNDPILRFFAAHSVRSSRPCTYALETHPSFFVINHIDVGDQLILNHVKSKGYFFTHLE